MDALSREIDSRFLEPRHADESAERRHRPRVTIEGMADAVITTDADGVVVYLNQAARTLTGWSQAEAAGRPVETVFRIVDRATNLAIECPAARALREGVVVGLPEGVMIVTRDGTSRPVDDGGVPLRGASPICNAEGEVVGAMLVFSDAVERRWRSFETQEALALAGEVIARLSTPLAVLGTNLEIATANASFYEILQTSKDEAEGRPFREIGGARWDTDRLGAWIEAVASGEHDGGDFDVEQVSEAIGRKPLTLSGRRIAHRSDGPGLVLISIKDTRREGRSPPHAPLSEDRYRRLFEAARDGILILDAVEARVLDANPFMVELLGYSLGELLGKELWEIGLFSEIRASQAVVETLLRDGYVRYNHLPLVAKDRTEIEVEFVSNVYPERDTKVIQCNIRDITERRLLERLATKQARDSETASQRKDEFLAMLSHELRNPLASILNCVQIFQLRPERDPVHLHAREVLERQVGHLTRLVDDLLEVSRISSGSFRLDLRRCDARDVVERSIESIGPMIRKLGHELTTSIPPGPVWLEADSDRLEQVVVNLLSNAAKYTDVPGRIALDLRREGEEVVIRVSDSGIGIAPELLPRVFDLFRQADRSIERSQGGLGVGLTLVERIVGMHRGTVVAQSPGLGHGCEFIVRLPEEAASPGMGPASPAKGVPPPLRVLVVDDNVDYADGVALLLRASGYEVEVVHNGPDALRSAIDCRPDFIVLDIGLPGMSGYEVAGRIRREPGLEDMRIIAVSGYPEDRDETVREKARFDKYLLKPVLIDELKAQLVPA
jgi:PAS domain S-box-containing protein